MKRITDRLEAFLRTRGLRLTRQRLAVLDAIYATHKHLTADELYEALQRHERTARLRISRATVYRTLALFCEGGFVQALDVGRDRGTLYEHTLGHQHHDHMICLDCGRIIEFSDELLERAQEAAVRRTGFHSTSHRLNVFGSCARCAGKAESAAG
ncbi:MAG TPA: Fur family transcriptional regulator [Planctomycetota bacterium]|nr:Fur family transcriptional regulator [Planctomycetota bacterium]